MILINSVAQQGCTNVPDPDRPPFLLGQGNAALPATLLTASAEAQPSLTADTKSLSYYDVASGD